MKLTVVFSVVMLVLGLFVGGAYAQNLTLTSTEVGGGSSAVAGGVQVQTLKNGGFQAQGQLEGANAGSMTTVYAGNPGTVLTFTGAVAGAAQGQVGYGKGTQTQGQISGATAGSGGRGSYFKTGFGYPR